VVLVVRGWVKVALKVKGWVKMAIRKRSGISLGVMWAVWVSTGNGLGLVWGSCGQCGCQPEVVWD
jgi:hypothetical protein